MSNASERGVLWCQRHLLWMTRFRSMEPRDVIAYVLHWTDECHPHSTADEELQAGYHRYLSEHSIETGSSFDVGDVQNKQFASEIGRLDEAFRRYKDWEAQRRKLSAQEESGKYPAPGEWHQSDDEGCDLLQEFAFLVAAGDDDEGQGDQP